MRVSSNSSPSYLEQWDRLALDKGNLLQSTHFDSVQRYFQSVPIYIECSKDGELIGGLKLYVTQSRRLPFLNKTATIFGDIICRDPQPEEPIQEYLKKELRNILKREKITIFSSKNYYGEHDFLLGEASSEWGIASIDLSQTEESFSKNMHSKHRNMINKARKSGLEFEESEDIERLLCLIKETYSGQEKSMPDPDFLRHLYSSLKEGGHARLYFVKSQDSQYLSGGLIQKLGTCADYAFGGSVRNNLGSGQFLHYNIFKVAKEEGFLRYNLGQVALERDEGNLKFSEGISRFKRRFGVTVARGVGEKIILSKGRDRLWNLILKLTKTKS